MSYVQKLTDAGAIKPDPFVSGSVQYETIMGSEAYGVSSGDSDRDIYGFCIPPKDEVFPHLRGEILGFGRQKKRFGQWQQHHITFGDYEYDFAVYNIVKFFQLAMEGTPNVLDALYTPQRCILHSTKIGNMVRDRREIFLSKKVWHTYKGYAFSQMKKVRSKDVVRFVRLCRHFDLDPLTASVNNVFIGSPPDPKVRYKDPAYQLPHPENDRWQDLFDLLQSAERRGGWGKRLAKVVAHGFDTKFAYHIVRLLDQADQLLTIGEMDLTRDRERMKAVRRGEWALERLEEFFEEQEKALQTLYESSTLPHKPDEEGIKKLLLDCLEEYYGSLEGAVSQPNAVVTALRQIKDIANGVKL